MMLEPELPQNGAGAVARADISPDSIERHQTEHISKSAKCNINHGDSLNAEAPLFKSKSSRIKKQISDE